MRLTVSIVNYGTPDLVVQCIDSLKKFPPSLTNQEIVVVDNQSGDGSLQRIAGAHPDVRVVDAGANLGFAGGNNLVLKDCSADFVMLLNSDALVVEGTCDQMILTLLEHPDAGAVGARIVNESDGHDQDYPTRFPTIQAMLCRALGGEEYPAAGMEAPQDMERLHGAGIMIRSKLLRSVGLLDDSFFMYDEDVDWCIRARRAGWKLLLDPVARVLHHGGASSERLPSGKRARLELSATAVRMRFELRRSRYRLYRKHCSFFQTLMLKFFTDAVMVAQILRAIALLLVRSESPASVATLIRANLLILRINPFGADFNKNDR